MIHFILLSVLFYALIMFGFVLGKSAEQRRRGNGYRPKSE
jgi:hypothetical protein